MTGETMTCSVTLSNTVVLNKYLWMGRQLRNFNDVGSIINWANAMSMVKGLLLKPKNVSSLPAHSAPAPRTPIPSPHLPSPQQTTTPLRSLSTRSITPLSTICFKPIMEKILTKSPPSFCSYVPSKPTPLTTHTLSLPNIPSADSHPFSPKRRKLSSPPSVDYHAATEFSHPTTTEPPVTQTSHYPGQGMHIWHKRLSSDDHYWEREMIDGADEYIVTKVPTDLDSPYKLKNVASGIEFNMFFSKQKVESLFRT